MKKLAITLLTTFTLSLIAVANDNVDPALNENAINIPKEVIEAEMKQLHTTLTLEEITNINSEVESVTSTTKHLEQNILDLEEQLELIKTDIANMETELKDVVAYGGGKDLSKYDTPKLDVAEVEVVNGDVFQVDIYDLGQKWSQSEKEDFFAKYVDGH